MNHSVSISEEQLNAFVDHQLDGDDRGQVLAAISKDPQLAEQFYQLFEMKEWLQLAYREPPLPVQETPQALRPPRRSLAWAAMVLLTLVVLVAGPWWPPERLQSAGGFYDLSQLASSQFSADKLLVHIDTDDPQRIERAMQSVQVLLAQRYRQARPIEVEVVANGIGLDAVQRDSSHAGRVASLSARYPNVKFKACGFAMEAQRLKTGQAVILAPQVKEVDAALNQILRRLRQGWSYIKA